MCSARRCCYVLLRHHLGGSIFGLMPNERYGSIARMLLCAPSAPRFGRFAVLNIEVHSFSIFLSFDFIIFPVEMPD